MSKARDLANAGTALTTVSATELGYLDGVTSAVQTQINAKQATVSGVNDTEIGYLDGVTSAIQTQLDGKVPATIVDAKGDIIAASAADTVARLAVGANDTVLTADSTAATGLKWATPSSGGMTLISTTSLTGANTINITSIPSTFNNLQLVIRNYKPAFDGDYLNIRVNNDSNTRYRIVSAPNTNQGSLSFNDTSWSTVARNDNSVAEGLFILDIPNYANTSTWKIATFFGVNNHPTITNNNEINLYYMAYNQTAAISQINLVTSNGTNFTSGTALLYGVK
jgi:hypothetical protein